MCEHKFFVCKHCGNLVGMIYYSGAHMICCGDEMTELVPNTTEASTEKHLPVVHQEGNVLHVSIGSAPHPMLKEHYIQWVYLLSDKGGHRKCLKPGDEPKVTFVLDDEKPLAVYAYCNLHGLWMTQL